MMNSHWTSHFVNVKINNVSFISFDFSHLSCRSSTWSLISCCWCCCSLFQSGLGWRIRECFLAHNIRWGLGHRESIFANNGEKSVILFTRSHILHADGQVYRIGDETKIRLLHFFYAFFGNSCLSFLLFLFIHFDFSAEFVFVLVLFRFCFFFALSHAIQ